MYSTYARVAAVVVRLMRERKGIEQQVFASDLNVPKSTWSKIERGDSALTVDLIFAVCQQWGISSAALISYVDATASSLSMSGWEIGNGLTSTVFPAPIEHLYQAVKPHINALLVSVEGASN